ncbi:MAG TPA: glycosyltransferase family A protein, partial [Cyclobacteriaceae bacterium]
MNSISIIVATYNGAKKLPFLLDALMIQSIKHFEIIVVVDGSTDDTLKVLGGYANRFNTFRILSQENSGRSKARNRGVKDASGELLIFYDDDMEPAPDSVDRHIQFHNQHNNVLLTGNQVEQVEQQKTDIQNYKATLSHKWISGYSQSLVSLTVDTIFFTAANCSIPTKVFNVLEGFDERLTDAEDHDLAYRALQMGIAVYFDKENKAIHHDPITCASYIKRLREYQGAHSKLAALHPE